MVEPIWDEYVHTLTFEGNSWVLVIHSEDAATYLTAYETTVTRANPIKISDHYFMNRGREELIEFCRQASKEELDGALKAELYPA